MKRFNTIFVILCLITLPSSAAHFQDSNGMIIIRSETDEFRIESSEFPAYEPTYEAPSDGAIRIWTDAYQCLQKDGTQYGDSFFSESRFNTYVSKIAYYQAAYEAAHMTPTPTPQPTIYADVQVSSDVLNIAGGSITFQGFIKDAGGTVLPVNESWIIRLRNDSGDEIDAFNVTFSNGVTPEMQYTCPPNANLGRIHVDEADFEPVSVPGIGTFQVKLLNPVEITIYREL